MRWIYYKLRQVLQSAMIITNCDSTARNKMAAVKKSIQSNIIKKKLTEEKRY